MNRKSRAIPKQIRILIMAACLMMALLPDAVLAETENSSATEGSGPRAMELSVNGGLGTMGGEPVDITGDFTDPNFLAAVRRDLRALGKADNDPIYADDLARITTLDLADMDIQNLDGIENFVNLEELYCSGNHLASLDVGGFAYLKRLDCSYNQLAELDVSSLSELIYLDCVGNQLTELYASGLDKLEWIYCAGNQLTELYVSGLSRLQYLNCEFNQLSAIYMTGLSGLERFYCSYNQLVDLDISTLSNLRFFDCSYNKISSLDISGLSSLEYLDCSNNQIAGLVVSGSSNLKWLYCSNNQLSSLEVSGLNKLEGLDCSYNQLTELDTSGLTSLLSLFCSNNRLEMLYLCESEKIEFLDSRYNYFSGKDKVELYNNETVDDDDFIPQFDKDYELTVAGVTVHAGNANSITGPGIDGIVSYDKASKTLTLNNAKIAVSDEDWECGIYSRENIKIQLIGENTIGTKLTDVTYITTHGLASTPRGRILTSPDAVT